MNSRTRFSITASALLCAAALALAGPRAIYRIALHDGSTLLARDQPRPVGSVMLFHRSSDGKLTGVPREEVEGVTSGAEREDVVSVSAGAPQKETAMLQPGEVVVLGPTAPGTATAPEATVSAARPAMVSGGFYDPRNPLYGYSAGYPGNPAAVSSASGVVAPLAPGDLARALSAEPPNLEPSIAPNGFPTAPGLATPLIGSDGQPILAPAGAPGSTPTTIGPNGTPVFAAPGMPGSSPNPIGPNGTPVLAPPGAPGSAATVPPTGSNGYPASRAPGK